MPRLGRSLDLRIHQTKWKVHSSWAHELRDYPTGLWIHSLLAWSYIWSEITSPKAWLQRRNRQRWHQNPSLETWHKQAFVTAFISLLRNHSKREQVFARNSYLSAQLDRVSQFKW